MFEVVFDYEQILQTRLYTAFHHFFITLNIIILDWIDQILLAILLQGRQVLEAWIVSVDSEEFVGL